MRIEFGHHADPALRERFGDLTIRPSQPEDLPAVASLAERVFAESRPGTRSEWLAELRWMFQGSHLGCRASSVAVDGEGLLVGHYGSLIRRFQVGRKIVRTGVPVDNMIDEAHRGGRLQWWLFENQRRWAKLVDVTWGIGAPTEEAYRIGRRLLGYRRLTTMKVLRANLASFPRHRLHALGRWRTPMRHPRRARIETLDRFDSRFAPLWERYRDDYRCTEERSLDWLRWRFDEAPRRTYTRLALVTGGEILRYAVIRHPPPGDGTWVIVDLWGSSEPIDLAAMARGIMRWASGRAPWLEISLAATEPHLQALLAAGFYWEGKERPLVFTVFEPDKVPERVVQEPSNWYVTEAFHDTL